MGNKSKKNFRETQTREKVFKEIARNPRDMVSLELYAKKHGLVQSGNKFRDAIKSLQDAGRIIVKDGKVSVNAEFIKKGTFVISGGKAYVTIDNDNHQYGISRKDSEGFRSNEKVLIGFSYLDDPSVRTPFIISNQKENAYGVEEQSSSIARKVDSNVVYGRVMKTDHDNLVFIPNDKKRFKQNIVILNDRRSMAQYQDKICTLELVTEEGEGAPAMGSIKEIKGEAGNPIAEYDAIAESHGANMGWSDKAVLDEIDNIPEEVDLSKYKFIDEDDNVIGGDGDEKIVDLRDLMFTTTDPATCKDMDDAIFSRINKDGTIDVYTAVANVTKYVNLDSEIGRRYIQAGFTTYAPNKAYNILPPQLSTNICSLNPNVDRLAFVVKTTIDSKTGRPIQSKIMDAVIRSQEKYSYEQAQEICDNFTDDEFKKLQSKIESGEELSKEEQVVVNNKVSNILWKNFKTRDLLQFNTRNEYDIVFSQDMADILDIKEQPHIPYHKVIEAFMLTANEASAEFAEYYGIPNIYRVHDKPNENKLEQAEEFFAYLGLPFDDDLSPQGIKNIIQKVKGTTIEKTVNNFLVRMQSKAKYSITTNPEDCGYINDNQKNANKRKQRKQLTKTQVHVENEENPISHFGLQSEHYSHTTSPIRRISDYITHCNILAFTKGKELLSEEYVKEVCDWANQMQDENDLAEREFQELNSAIYCENHINDVMKGYICSFRKVDDIKNATVDDIYVVVENEEKGIKVRIPAKELLASKNVNSKNIAISAHGSAIVDKNSGAPLLRLCSSVNFRIIEADRNTRVVYASTNLNREATITPSSYEHLTIGEAINRLEDNPELSIKKQRMLKNRAYKKVQADNLDEIERGRYVGVQKTKKQMREKIGTDFIDDDEAYKANRQSKQARRRKIEKFRKDELEDFFDDEDESEN